MRADAARNRARVLEVAYDTFAADGLGVPIDEIARRAGVGAGTVYRHFPAKEDLYRAVIAERIRSLVEEGRALLSGEDPEQGFFTFLRSMVLQWGAADRGLVDALAGLGIDVNTVVPEAENDYLTMLGDLLRRRSRPARFAAMSRCPRSKRCWSAARPPRPTTATSPNRCSMWCSTGYAASEQGLTNLALTMGEC